MEKRRWNRRPVWDALLSVVILGACGVLLGADFVWDDDTGNHLWSDELNWHADSGVPGGSDYAVFNGPIGATCIVDTSAVAQRLYVTNSVGTVEIQVLGENTVLRADSLYVGQGVAGMSTARFTGNGTLQLGSDTTWGNLYVGCHILSKPWTTGGSLTVSGLVVNLPKQRVITVAQSANNTGWLTGRLDLAHAMIVSQAITNSLRIVPESDNTSYGLRFDANYVGAGSEGTIRLPVSLTNIYVDGSMAIGRTAIPSVREYPTIDLGLNHGLRNITATYGAVIGDANFAYSDGSATVTGFPANVDLTFGKDGSDTTFSFGAGTSRTFKNDWQLTGRFESHLHTLRVGQPGGANVTYPDATLDISRPRELVGSITSTQVKLTELTLGYTYRGRGTLKLPGTIEAIELGSLYLGAPRILAPDCSIIDLGSNSPLSVLSMDTMCFIADGRFIHHDDLGTYEGLPRSATVTIGDWGAARGKLILANGYNKPYTTVLAGMGGFIAWLDEFSIGESTYSSGDRYAMTGVLDLRQCTNLLMDVDGAVNLGLNKGGVGCAYLANGTVTATELNVGAQSVAADMNVEGYLWLSNVVFAVDNAVTLGDAQDTGSHGLVTNLVCGTSSGIDLQTDALAITNGGRMFLKFFAPAVPNGIYWGLRLKGDARALLTAYTNASPALLSWDASALGPRLTRRFGIHYDGADDQTYVGLFPLPGGTIISVR